MGKRRAKPLPDTPGGLCTPPLTHTATVSLPRLMCCKKGMLSASSRRLNQLEPMKIVFPLAVFVAIGQLISSVTNGATKMWAVVAVLCSAKAVLWIVQRVTDEIVWKFEVKPALKEKMLKFLRDNQMPAAEVGWGMRVADYTRRIEAGNSPGIYGPFPEHTQVAARNLSALQEMLDGSIPSYEQRKMSETWEEVITLWSHSLGYPQSAEGIEQAIAKAKAHNEA